MLLFVLFGFDFNCLFNGKLTLNLPTDKTYPGFNLMKWYPLAGCCTLKIPYLAGCLMKLQKALTAQMCNSLTTFIETNGYYFPVTLSRDGLC